MPIADGKVWRKSGDGSGKFTVTLTGETFLFQSDANNRLLEYKKRKWSCRHFPNEEANRTFEEALAEEEKALQKLYKQFPSPLISDICKAVHHACGEKQVIVENVCSKLRSFYYEGEDVVVSAKNETDQEGKICSTKCGGGYEVSPSNKENAFSYSVELGNGNIIRDVASDRIRRVTPLLESDVSSFLLLVAHREGSSSPWILDESIRKEFSIPNKLHSFFLGNTSENTNSTWPIITVRNEREVNKEKNHKKRGLEGTSVVHSKSATVITLSDSESDEEPLAKKLFKSRSKKLTSSRIVNPEKVKKMKKEHIRNIGGRKKELKMETKLGKNFTKANEHAASDGVKMNEQKMSPKRIRPLNTGKRQDDLVKYLVPVATLSPSNITSPWKLAARKLETSIKLLTKALSDHDSISFRRACTVAVRTVPLALIETIENEVIRYALLKQFYQDNGANAMKKMSAEEKKAYRERLKHGTKPDPVLEKILYEQLNKKLEDLDVTTKKFLPEFEIIEGSTEFVRCLAISQFMHVFRRFLPYRCSVSADGLLEAIKSGEKGFCAVTGHYLVALLKTILNDAGSKDYYAYCTHLHRVPVTLGTVNELARLVLMDSRLSENANPKHSVDVAVVSTAEMGASTSRNCGDSGQEICSHSLLADRLKHVAFYTLPTQDQISLLEQFVELVWGTESFNKYFTEIIGSNVRELRDSKKFSENELTKLKETFENFPKKPPKPVDEMTPPESKVWSNIEAERQRTKENIEVETGKLAEVCRELHDLEIISDCAQRLKPLGYDRFHRRYWFFPESPNRGIFIERGWWCSTASSENGVENEKTDNLVFGDREASACRNLDSVKSPGGVRTLDDFMKGGISYPAGFESNDWYRIRDVKTLRLLCSSLLINGYRESSLLDSIKRKWEDIIASLKGEDVKNESDITEMDLLKEHLNDLANSLRSREFIFADVKDVFSCKVGSANTFDCLKDLVLELVNSLPQYNFKNLFVGNSNSATFSLEAWIGHVKSANRFSELTLLITILEQNIPETKACNICWKRRNRDQLIACEKCNRIAHKRCVQESLEELSADNKYICCICLKPSGRRR